jgi:hypothetical protein
MTTGGNNNIDPALLKKITKNAKNKQQWEQKSPIYPLYNKKNIFNFMKKKN